MNTAYNAPLANAVPIVPLTVEDHKQYKKQHYSLPQNNTSNNEINEEQIRRLMEQGFTRGEFCLFSNHIESP